MIDPNKISEEQRIFVDKYKKIHNQLTLLQADMDSLRTESEKLISDLKELRIEEKNIFKNGKK